MSSKKITKPCGCPVIKFTGKDRWLGVLQGLCDKCRTQQKVGK